MTIDEGMNCVEKAIPKSAIGRMYDELKWWRKQDFIRRDDAISKLVDIAKHYETKEEIFIGGVISGCAIELQQIPKAEYTGEQK